MKHGLIGTPLGEGASWVRSGVEGAAFFAAKLPSTATVDEFRS